jgi:hypothetical protein
VPPAAGLRPNPTPLRDQGRGTGSGDLLTARPRAARPTTGGQGGTACLALRRPARQGRARAARRSPPAPGARGQERPARTMHGRRGGSAAPPQVKARLTVNCKSVAWLSVERCFSGDQLLGRHWAVGRRGAVRTRKNRRDETCSSDTVPRSPGRRGGGGADERACKPDPVASQAHDQLRHVLLACY